MVNILMWIAIIFCVPFSLLLLVVVIISIVEERRLKTLRYESSVVSVKVCDKKCSCRYPITSIRMFGSLMLPETRYQDMEYNVYFMYEGKKYCKDDVILYHTVNIGDCIPQIVRKGYDKSNKLKHVCFDSEI